MKIYIDFNNFQITKKDSDVMFQGDVLSNAFELLFYNYSDTSWFPTMSQLAPNGRQAGDFAADPLEPGESQTVTIDGVTYLKYKFTIGPGWCLVKGKSNFFIWKNTATTPMTRKCIGRVMVTLNESTETYFIDDVEFNPSVKAYIDSCIDEQNEVIAQLGNGEPKYFDTAANIALLEEDKGLAVATDTGHLYYWDVTEEDATKYTDSGLVYNDLSAYYTKTQADALLANKADKSDTYTKQESDNKFAPKTTAVTHTGNQLKDYSGNNIYPNLADGQVDIKKLNARTINGMYAYAKSTNLFDRLSIVEETQINNSGNLETYSNCYVMNKPISVTAGEKLVYFVDGGQESAISSDGFLAYYDIDGNFLSKTRADGGASGTTYTIVTNNITLKYYRVLVRYFTVPSNAVKALWQGYTNQLNLINKISIQHLSDFTGNYQDYYATKGSVDDYSTEKIKFSWKPTWDSSQAPYIFAGVQGADSTYTSSALASVMVAINSCKISKNYRDNRNKTSTHFSHDSTLQILNDKGYIVETRDDSGVGDNPDVLTAYVGLTIFDDVKNLSTSSTNTKYSVAKNGDSVGSLTIISGAGEPNGYFIGTNLYIIFSAKLSDNHWYELYRVFNTTNNTFGNIEICKLGTNDFTCENICSLVGLSNIQSSISMNATITFDGNYYYAGLCLYNHLTTSAIMYSSDMVTWNLWLKPSGNTPTNAIFENAVFVQGNYLYSACRQSNGYIWLAKINKNSKNIDKSILINADSCRPDFFTDGTYLYLAYSVNDRNLTQIMRISQTLERSKVVNQILDECIYPSIKYSSDNQVIISATANNSTAVYLRRTTEIEPYNIYDMIDLLPTMFSKFNEV